MIGTILAEVTDGDAVDIGLNRGDQRAVNLIGAEHGATVEPFVAVLIGTSVDQRLPLGLGHPAADARTARRIGYIVRFIRGVDDQPVADDAGRIIVAAVIILTADQERAVA
jgi:hypothetical protein